MTLPEIKVEPANGRSPKRIVKLRLGEWEHTDACDPYDGWQRSQLVERYAMHQSIPSHEIAKMDDAIIRAAEVSDKGPGIDYEMLSCAELMKQDFTVHYWIDRILAMKQPCILAGPRKSLKTSLLIDLLLAIARGGCFLGMFRAQRAESVGLFTAESGLATVSETLARQCNAAGYDPNEISNLHVSAKVPWLENADHLDALRREIENRDLEVVALDPLYKMMPGDQAGNLFITGRLLDQLDRISQKTGCTVILCHHTRKTGRENSGTSLDLDDIAWAGFQEWARQWLLVSRRERYQHDGEHHLEMSSGGSAGHAGVWHVSISEGTRATEGGRFWQVEVLKPDEARDREQGTRERTEANKERIVRAILKYPLGETKSIICGATGLKEKAFNAVFQELLDAGTVVFCEITKPNRKKPYPAYRLADTQ